MAPFMLSHLDHLVITASDIDRTVAFYQALGMELVEFRHEGTQVTRKALVFGVQKINLHEKGKEFEPKAALPTPGSLDLCFITATPVANVIDHLNENGIQIVEGPVPRTGAQGPMTSVYVRDPDGNLIEISNYISPAVSLTGRNLPPAGPP